MFSQLSQRLSESLQKIRGVGRLTEKNIQDALSEVRLALLEADVALSVVKEFIEHIRGKALGQQVISSVRPGDALVKLVNDELTNILGAEQSELNLKAEPPAVILLAGLQGSGKTTTAAKLALWIQKNLKKKILLVPCDVYRPAAIDQLVNLSKQIGIDCFPSNADMNPLVIAENALKIAKQQYYDIVIIDTAGRLHIDEELMKEISALHQLTKPVETLLVVDSMVGQDAATMAKTFNDTLELTGTILTKTDGDARGGAALSMRFITKKPIKFMGIGEKVDALEAFYPDRVASRILGMGDIVSLVEEAQQKVDHKEAKKVADKIAKGKRFDFNDFSKQLEQMKNMGGMQALLSKLPAGMGQVPAAAKSMMSDKMITKMEAIISSMTKKERTFPALIDSSRKRRISSGSGTSLQDVNQLLKQFDQMQKMLKRMKGDKMAKQLQQLQQLQNKLPPHLRNKLF